MIAHITLRLTLYNPQGHDLVTLAYQVSNLRNLELILNDVSTWSSYASPEFLFHTNYQQGFAEYFTEALHTRDR